MMEGDAQIANGRNYSFYQNETIEIRDTEQGTLSGLRTREVGTVGDQQVFSNCRNSSSRRASTFDLLQLEVERELEQ